VRCAVCGIEETSSLMIVAEGAYRIACKQLVAGAGQKSSLIDRDGPPLRTCCSSPRLYKILNCTIITPESSSTS
jgi:hypothetical protein